MSSCNVGRFDVENSIFGSSFCPPTVQAVERSWHFPGGELAHVQQHGQ